MTAIDERVFNARPDTMDFRDLVYQPSLIEIPPVVGLDRYRRFGVPVLDQGNEGACTGFGLATVANYLLRRRESDPDVTPVSARMMYEMARLYDEWEGEDYEGASARGAVKGWHKHGVCSDDMWAYRPGEQGTLTMERTRDAGLRPLGSYYRVNHKSLVDLHAALAEVGIVYATAVVHSNWEDPPGGIIRPRSTNTATLGGHAFAIVAYDARGLWIQNSWGEDWGRDGFALLTYEDWLTSATDTWVAQLGAPVSVVPRRESLGDLGPLSQPHVYTFRDMRPHVVTIGDDGALASTGTYATKKADLARMIEQFTSATEDWPQRRAVFYAHGGLVKASHAVTSAARLRTRFLDNQIYPFFFVWHTDWYSTLRNMIDDLFDRWSAQERAGAPLDFVRDRIDDMLEQAAWSTLLAKEGWSEIKENGIRATQRKDGGARALLDVFHAAHPESELHLVGHSAGSILLAALAQYIGTETSRTAPVRGKGLGRSLDSIHLWAPAATMELFRQTFLPLARRGRIDRMTVFALRDQFERDDSAGPYGKSILYLVSNALEERRRIPLLRPDGQAILGLEKFLDDDPGVAELREKNTLDVVVGPTPAGTPGNRASHARTHVAFDTDSVTHMATIARILRKQRVTSSIPAPAMAAHEQATRAAHS